MDCLKCSEIDYLITAEIQHLLYPKAITLNDSCKAPSINKNKSMRLWKLRTGELREKLNILSVL